MDIPSEEEFKERPKRQLFLAAIAAGTVALKKIYAVGTPIRLLRDKFQADPYPTGWYNDCYYANVRC